MQKQQTSDTLHSAFFFFFQKDLKRKECVKTIAVELPHDVLTEQDDEKKQQLKHSITVICSVLR